MAAADAGKAGDQFDGVDILRHLVTQLALDPHPQRRTAGDELIGEGLILNEYTFTGAGRRFGWEP